MGEFLDQALSDFPLKTKLLSSTSGHIMMWYKLMILKFRAIVNFSWIWSFFLSANAWLFHSFLNYPVLDKCHKIHWYLTSSWKETQIRRQTKHLKRRIHGNLTKCWHFCCWSRRQNKSRWKNASRLSRTHCWTFPSGVSRNRTEKAAVRASVPVTSCLHRYRRCQSHAIVDEDEASYQRQISGWERWDSLSLVVRKHVFGVSDQVRHKPACSATEAS